MILREHCRANLDFVLITGFVELPVLTGELIERKEWKLICDLDQVFN